MPCRLAGLLTGPLKIQVNRESLQHPLSGHTQGLQQHSSEQGTPQAGCRLPRLAGLPLQAHHLRLPRQPSSALRVYSSSVGFSQMRPTSEEDTSAPSKRAPFRFAH